MRGVPVPGRHPLRVIGGLALASAAAVVLMRAALHTGRIDLPYAGSPAEAGRGPPLAGIAIAQGGHDRKAVEAHSPTSAGAPTISAPGVEPAHVPKSVAGCGLGEIGCAWAHGVGRVFDCGTAHYARALLRRVREVESERPTELGRGIEADLEWDMGRWSTRLCLGVTAAPEMPPWLAPYAD